MTFNEFHKKTRNILRSWRPRVTCHIVFSLQHILNNMGWANNMGDNSESWLVDANWKLQRHFSRWASLNHYCGRLFAIWICGRMHRYRFILALKIGFPKGYNVLEALKSSERQSTCYIFHFLLINYISYHWICHLSEFICILITYLLTCIANIILYYILIYVYIIIY